MAREERGHRTQALALLLAGVLCCGVVGTAAATQEGCGCWSNEPASQFEGYVRDSVSGRSQRLAIQRQVTRTVLDRSHRLTEVRYQVEVPASAMGLQSNSESRVDSSISYRLTLTQYFNELEFEGDYYVAVSRYRGTWRRLDTQVAASDAYLLALVESSLTLGGGGISGLENTNPFTPGSYASRTLTPSWAGTYVRVGFLEAQCGQINATLYRRNNSAHTWELWFNVCEGVPPWGF